MVSVVDDTEEAGQPTSNPIQFSAFCAASTSRASPPSYLTRHYTASHHKYLLAFTTVKMGLWPKKFPGKMGETVHFPTVRPQSLILSPTAEPMWPFMAAGLIVAWGINAGANAMMDCTTALHKI